MGCSLSQATRPPLCRCQRGCVNDKLSPLRIICGCCLQAAHKCAMPQLCLCVGPNELEPQGLGQPFCLLVWTCLRKQRWYEHLRKESGRVKSLEAVASSKCLNTDLACATNLLASQRRAAHPDVKLQTPRKVYQLPCLHGIFHSDGLLPYQIPANFLLSVHGWPTCNITIHMRTPRCMICIPVLTICQELLLERSGRSLLCSSSTG